MTQTTKTIKTKKAKVESEFLCAQANSMEITNALIKKAMGYTVTETQEEFSIVDGNLELTKRKVNTKYYPPDFTAISVLLEKLTTTENVESLSSEELETMAKNLIEKFKNLKGE